MKMNKKLTIFIMIFMMLLSTLFLQTCSKKDRKDMEVGLVKFDLNGTSYTIDQRQFMIRVDPLIGEGEKVKSIREGEKHNFEFNILPTPVRAQKEIEATGKNLEQLAQGKTTEGLGISTFDVVWVIETDDPLEALKYKISYDTHGLNLKTFALLINVPGYAINNPPKERHSCWVIIDEISGNRAKGRFGGTFEVNSLKDTSIKGKELEITNGVFDVPFKKLYRYE